MDATLNYSLPLSDGEPQGPAAELAGDVRAGFPSPAGDAAHGRLDLNAYVVRRPASTFFLRVEGTSMVDAGFDEGDIVAVDRAVEPYDGCVAVCCLDGEFTLKRVRMREGAVELHPANPAFAPLRVGPDDDFTVWGVVTFLIKKI